MKFRERRNDNRRSLNAAKERGEGVPGWLIFISIFIIATGAINHAAPRNNLLDNARLVRNVSQYRVIMERRVIR